MSAVRTPALTPYPVHVEGRIEHPSRALWLLKWLFVIPHYVVLAFLWIAFIVCAIMAFLAMLFTGRYPQGLFGYNVGVLRWSWRVAFYAFGANGTDRYPPFTLQDVPDYPAHLEVEYPTHQRRGLPLIGWWLAGIPHYVIVGIFLGGGLLGSHVGLIGVLVFVGVILLAVSGEYPRQIFDLVLGLNRWALRVAAYGALMTEEYPPFRIDSGETDVTMADRPDPAPAAPVVSATAASRHLGAGRWTVLVIAGLTTVASCAALAAGIVGLAVNGTQRDAAGFVMTSSRAYATPTYALVSASYRTGDPTSVLARDLLGTVRVRVSSQRPVFVGIGHAAPVEAYTSDFSRAVATRLDGTRTHLVTVRGGPPQQMPSQLTVWAAHSTARGTQTLNWSPRGGDWRIVVMNADGSPGVNAMVSVGARLPHLETIGWALLGGGALVLALSAGAIYLAVGRPLKP